MTPLELLLDRALSGDRAARDELFGQLRPIIRAMARRLLHGDNEASDFAQEVLMRMARGFADFRGPSMRQLVAWARMIASRYLVDYLRSAPPAAEPLPPDFVAAVEGGPLEGLVRAEEMARLAEALSRLPEHYRAIVEARLFEGTSCVDIAGRMGRTRVWVSVMCLRAVRRLQQELGEQP
jgi:RNA polymerase sigma-70 factor (ECF subfamily)